LTVSKLSF